MRRKHLLVAVVTCCVFGVAQAKRSPPKITQKQAIQITSSVTREYRAWLDTHQINAGAIAVSYRGNLLATDGKARNANAPAPVASLSKAITAICVIKALAAKNQSISLNLGQILPELFEKFEVSDLRLRKITVAQLISHNSGLGSGVANAYLPKMPRFTDEIKSWQFAKIAEHHLQASPGTGYRYSNANYLLLGLVIESLVNKSYEGYCTDKVLKPAGVTTARLNRKWRALSAFGGWEISAVDHLKLINTYFSGNRVLGSEPLKIVSKSLVKRRVYYGPGILMKKTRLGFRFWHSGSWKWRSRRINDQFGAYFASYGNGISVSVNFAAGADKKARRELGGLIYRASHPKN